MIPAGKWYARAVEATVGKSDKDEDQVAVELVFEPDQDDEVDGQSIVWRGGFSEKSEEWTLKALITMGWKGDWDTFEGITDNVVELVVEHNQYNGKYYANVKYVNSPRRGPVTKKQMSSGEKAAFAARMKGKVLAMQAQLGAQSSGAAAPARSPLPNGGGRRAPVPAAAAPEDDSIPF